MARTTRDTVYAVYFTLHLFITLAIDATIAIPRQYLFPFQQFLADFHIAQNNDLLVAARPVWLQTFVWVELIFQTPFFLVAAIALWRGSKKIYPAVLIYGVEAAITTLACLAEVAFIDGLTPPERINLFAVYLPTFVIPLVLTADFYSRIVAWAPSTSHADKIK